ncbi:MAG TPA: chromate transporter [Candidatus Gallimonas intestinavium]|uniref:Chromate transporter n=1 Tax=Candidatus Gallimonas intestinavium TaxID=2838603 RepID=A0A9D2G5Q0_9FIRM|nr:chromate transporter [Candidatus Gallimonas intestinavium]
MQKFKTCLKLFLVLFKIGLFTFGGGYAMISLLENEFITKRKWLESDEFLNVVAIAESTPGPVAINAATYVGYKLAGFWGSLSATVAVALPSFVIIFLISLFFDAFLSLQYVAYAFDGIQVCVIFLILNAGVKMLFKLEKNVWNILVTGLVIAAMVTLSVLSIAFSSVWYILITAGLALLLYLVSWFRTRRIAKTGEQPDEEEKQ